MITDRWNLSPAAYRNKSWTGKHISGLEASYITKSNLATPAYLQFPYGMLPTCMREDTHENGISTARGSREITSLPVLFHPMFFPHLNVRLFLLFPRHLSNCGEGVTDCMELTWRDVLLMEALCFCNVALARQSTFRTFFEPSTTATESTCSSLGVTSRMAISTPW